jgi:hypothetical protein
MIGMMTLKRKRMRMSQHRRKTGLEKRTETISWSLIALHGRVRATMRINVS